MNLNKSICILKYLTIITDFFEVLPLIFCILFYKKLNTKGLKVFYVYALLLFVFVSLHLTSIFLNSKQLYHNVLRVYTLIEFTFLALFFFYSIKSRSISKLILLSIFPFWAFCIQQYLYVTTYFSVLPLLVEFIFFMIVIIYFFYEKMKTELIRPLYQSMTFWLSVGLFIYFSGNFFYLLLIQSTDDIALKNQFKIIYCIITIAKNLLLSCAFFASEEVQTTSKEFNIPDELNLDSFHPKSTFS